ncbi:unnamed protein product [Sphagnum balticum]
MYFESGELHEGDEQKQKDDWEAAFDALHIQGASSDQIQHSEMKDSHERKPNGVHHLDLQSVMLKPEYMYKNNGFGG